MRFRDLLAFSWLYKKRNWGRLIGNDCQLIFIFTCLFILGRLLYLFAWIDFLFSKIKTPIILQSINSQDLSLFPNMKKTFEITLWVLFMGLLIYFLVSYNYFIRSEILYDKERLRNYYNRIADSRQIARELVLSHSISLPADVLVASIIGFILSGLAVAALTDNLAVNPALIPQAFSPLVSLIMLGLELLLSFVYPLYLSVRMKYKIEKEFLGKK